MPDFLDVAEQPDGDGWALSPDGANPYPNEQTLAELGVSDGAVLVLYERPAAPDKPSACHHAKLTRPAPDTAPRRGRAELADCRTSPERADRPHAARQALAPGSLPACRAGTGRQRPAVRAA